MIVTTQKELTDALANPRVSVIEIKSPAGVWLQVEGQRPGVRVVARGSSSVEAWGSSSVEAWGSSSVVAWDSSSVEAWGSSSVVAWDSSSVVAWDSSSVVAWDSSSVVAWDSSSVVAWGSSRVVARGSSRVVATPHVAIHLHSARALVNGGVIIDVTKVDDEALTWIEHHGIKLTDDGRAIVYKAVDAALLSGYRFAYPIGETVTDAKWQATRECGNGLHFSPHPRQAKDYFYEASRFLACAVDVETLIPISGGTPKCKAPACEVLFEVSIDAEPMAVTA